MAIGAAVSSGAVMFGLICSNAAGQAATRTTAPVPNRNVTVAEPQRHNPPSGRALPGTVEGFVYGDTRSVTHNPAGACSGFSVSVIGEDRVDVKLKKDATGEYAISPQSPLYPGEYAVVLRPVSKHEKVSGGDVARAHGPGLMFDVLWSFQVAENAR